MTFDKREKTREGTLNRNNCFERIRLNTRMLIYRDSMETIVNDRSLMTMEVKTHLELQNLDVNFND